MTEQEKEELIQEARELLAKALYRLLPEARELLTHFLMGEPVSVEELHSWIRFGGTTDAYVYRLFVIMKSGGKGPGLRNTVFQLRWWLNETKDTLDA